jgi:UDPglucose--hexose-1-phosphate uridylyltransferase
VIIEHPRHDMDMAVLSHQELSAVLDAYRSRYRALMREPGTESVVVFRNRGGRAGASLGHPHSQIISTHVIVPLIRRREGDARLYHDRTGRCVHCDLIAQEREAGRRIVLESSRFLIVVPFAAGAPFEVWILPREHRPGFGAVSKPELGELAATLGRVLRAYRESLDDPEYNFVIHSAPKGFEAAPHLHWYLQILPRLSVPAGFELGSGIRINPSLPEDDAAVLAKAVAASAEILRRPGRPSDGTGG